ncbi:hypothetical protein C0991_000750 [Blastosporella zonata]|nr:hypothetical protein C0991_000750 [Blastosporella zonata]
MTECVDPILWAGTSKEVLAVLDGWEVERIMQLLDWTDSLVRQMTLKLLSRVDLGIVTSYYSQVIQTIPSGLSVSNLNSYGLRIIEIIDAQAGQDGELFAQELKTLLLRLEEASLDGQPILEAVVDKVLTHVRHAGIDFSIGFSTAMLTSLVESEQRQAQTMTVIVAALASEQCGKLSVRPLDILEGFYIASVQDACLLAMLRVSAECDDIPSSIIDTVTELGQRSKRHLRQRCEQFVSLVVDKAKLVEIVRKARSSSLPDFLAALMEANHQSDSPALPPAVTSSQSLSASKLRYDAYDAPLPGPKLRSRDVSSSLGAVPLTRVNSRLSESSADSLSKTLTPGELTLAASRRDLNLVVKDSPKAGLTSELSTDDLVSRVDLINLDSPFVSDPSEAAGPEIEGFERTWDSMKDSEVRGWFSGTVSVAMKRMESLADIRFEVISIDLPPYAGAGADIERQASRLRLFDCR